MFIGIYEEDKLFTLLELIEAVKRLTVIERVVVSLRSESFSQKDCGKLLGLTPPAIGYIYKRARKHLKEQLTT